MTQAPQLSPRSSVALGLGLIAMSLGFGALIYFQPQQLNAPAWVAYAAASAFLLAGLQVLAGTEKAGPLQDWLAVALILALLLPGAWVAFGGGNRQCEVTLPFIAFTSEGSCRVAFGVGALLGLAVFMLFIRRALNRQHDRKM